MTPVQQEIQGLQGAVQQLKVSSDKLVISKMSLDQLQKTPESALPAHRPCADCVSSLGAKRLCSRVRMCAVRPNPSLL